MIDPVRTNQTWESTWCYAIEHYAKLNGDTMSRMHRIVSELAESPKVTGLFAITSMVDLVISPYSTYPDWFDGRHLTLKPSSHNIAILFYRSGTDPSPQTCNASFDDAADLIASKCWELL